MGAHPPLTSLLQTHLTPGELTETREFQYLLYVDTQEAGRTAQARPEPSMQCCCLGKPRAQAPSLKRGRALFRDGEAVVSAVYTAPKRLGGVWGGAAAGHLSQGVGCHWSGLSRLLFSVTARA